MIKPLKQVYKQFLFNITHAQTLRSHTVFFFFFSSLDGWLLLHLLPLLLLHHHHHYHGCLLYAAVVVVVIITLFMITMRCYKCFCHLVFSEHAVQLNLIFVYTIEKNRQKLIGII